MAFQKKYATFALLLERVCPYFFALLTNCKLENLAENRIDVMWDKCCKLLADRLSPSAYQTWFAPTIPVAYTDGVLILQVKSQFVVEYIEENYINLLSKVIFTVFGTGTRLEYRVLIDSTTGNGSIIPSDGNNKEITRAEGERLGVDNYSAVRLMERDNVRDQFDSQLNASYTFENFIAGEPNKLARVAGLEIAKQPGYTAFNPLFIYGGSGVGKTHLANAIGNRVKLMYPEKKVLYVSANTFKVQYQYAAREKQIPNFLNFYQQIDVLIVDDIQYFSGLQGTQDTFFHIFNYLQQSHKQLILTSDRQPLELKDIEERLLTRFKWGLSAEITRPDFSLRKDILQYKIHRDGLSLSPEIVDFIANNVRNNVRDLEGVLASLFAYSTLTDKELSMDLAEQVVSRIVEIKPRKVLLEDILGAVSEYYNVTERSITGQARNKEVMLARHVAIYLCKELTEHSLKEIGSYIGNRTHATMLHSMNHVKEQMTIDPILRQNVETLRTKLKH